MSEEEKRQIEEECLLNCSKAKMIEKYIDELEESSALSELWCKSQQENKQLKEIIKEIREYINKNTEFEHDGDDYGYTEWVNIIPQNIEFINELLQILDKVKEVK